MTLREILGLWVGRVELALMGSDSDLRDGEEALRAGHAMRARAAAHKVLARVPGSVLALALLADACEVLGLEAERVQTLEELSTRAPTAEVWFRLGRARMTSAEAGTDARGPLLRALSLARPGDDLRRDVLLALCDLDLGEGEGRRAELWLDRLVSGADKAVAIRRAEARILQGDYPSALGLLEGLELDPVDGRAALAKGQCLIAVGRPEGLSYLIRAYVLEVRGATEALQRAIAATTLDDGALPRIRAVVEANGDGEDARFLASFARASGDPSLARKALSEAVLRGDASVVGPLLSFAIEQRDADTLKLALEHGRDALFATRIAEQAAGLVEVLEGASLSPTDRLARLREITEPTLTPWVEALLDGVFLELIPRSAGAAARDDLLVLLEGHARAESDLESLSNLAALAMDRKRPVRVAIVGEFNAGKSTFINALIGQDVAPTGILPTTATLHHLRYGPDPIARIMFRDAKAHAERTVLPRDLRSVLATLDVADVRKVEIQLPILSLTRVEIIDTPGFNAPDIRHAEAARGAFDEADYVVWLLDASQAMKQTEREVLGEVVSRELPVAVLVNKIDRLQEADRQKVLTQVSEGLSESGVVSQVEPIAFSAREALAGRMGDETALARSGWERVQAWLDQDVVGQSHLLKERALRRRARGIVSQVLLRMRKHGDAVFAEMERSIEAHRRLLLATARLEAQRADVVSALTETIDGALDGLRKELAMLTVGRSTDATSQDRGLQLYVATLGVDRLCEPLVRTLVAAFGEPFPPSLSVRPILRALIRGALSSELPSAEGANAIAHAIVAAMLELLYEQPVPDQGALTNVAALRELSACGRRLQDC